MVVAGEAHPCGGPDRVGEEEAERGLSPPAGHRHRHPGPGTGALEPVFEFYSCMARPWVVMATTVSLEHFIAAVLVHNTLEIITQPMMASLQTLIIAEAFCDFQYRRYQTRHFDNFLIFIPKMG